MKSTVIDQAFGLLSMRDEQLICTFEPNGRYSMLNVIIYGPVLMFALAICCTLFYGSYANAELTILFVVAVLSIFPLMVARSRKLQRYWITNKRVIAAKGILGFTVQSIPLEKISDVSLVNTWLHRLLGTASLAVKDMSGNVMALISVDKAPEVQLLILDHINDFGRGEIS